MKTSASLSMIGLISSKFYLQDFVQQDFFLNPAGEMTTVLIFMDLDFTEVASILSKNMSAVYICCSDE